MFIRKICISLIISLAITNCSWNLDYEDFTTKSCIDRDENQEFLCGDIWIDCRDGREYKTVWIDIDGGNDSNKNGQCWMAENLNYGEFITTRFEIEYDGIPQKFCQNNDSLKCEELGGLYLWEEILNEDGISKNSDGFVKGICPEGWHIPSKLEFEILNEIASGYPENLLKNSTANIGFSAKRAGVYLDDGIFPLAKTYFWTYETNSDLTSGNASIGDDRWALKIAETNAELAGFHSLHGCCLRCLKD